MRFGVKARVQINRVLDIIVEANSQSHATTQAKESLDAETRLFEKLLSSDMDIQVESVREIDGDDTCDDHFENYLVNPELQSLLEKTNRWAQEHPLEYAQALREQREEIAKIKYKPGPRQARLIK